MGKWDYWKKDDRSFYKDVFLQRANDELPTMESQKACMKIMSEKLRVKNPSILDIGCGSAYFLNTLSKVYNKYIYKGVDFNKEYLQIAEKVFAKKIKNGIVSFDQADAQNLPFKDNQFEIVYSVNTFPHIPNIRQAISEAIRVSKKYILIRMLIANETTIIKKSLNNDIDEDGNPTDYMLVNTYSMEYLEKIIDSKGKIEIIDDDFNAQNLINHFNLNKDITGSHIATSVLGGVQVKGVVLMHWKFLLISKYD